MKKCSYCGKEYPDEVAHCLVDGEPLPGSEPEISVVPQTVVPPASSFVSVLELVTNPTRRSWTEQQYLTIEVVLVCVLAFSPSVLSSLYVLASYGSLGITHTADGSAFSWGYSLLGEANLLALVWYLLLRRGKSFSGFGTALTIRIIGISVLLWIASEFVSYIFYDCLYFSGLVGIDYGAAIVRGNHHILGGGVFWTTILFEFLNPVYEELIVRAYLMTVVRQLTNSSSLAILISTALQTSYHLYQGVPMALAYGTVFLLFSIYYARTNRIAPVILAHLYNNVGCILWPLLR